MGLPVVELCLCGTFSPSTLIQGWLVTDLTVARLFGLKWHIMWIRFSTSSGRSEPIRYTLARLLLLVKRLKHCFNGLFWLAINSSLSSLGGTPNTIWRIVLRETISVSSCAIMMNKESTKKAPYLQYLHWKRQLSSHNLTRTLLDILSSSYHPSSCLSSWNE